MEETTKAELLAFRTMQPAQGAAGGKRGRGRDPLRDHGSKHKLAMRENTFMGRLPELLGEARCAELLNQARTGALVALREWSLYVHVDERGVSSPAMAITRWQAYQLLLLALEVADDILVGWTDRSFALGMFLERRITDLERLLPEVSPDAE